jgi:hypothetical protein
VNPLDDVGTRENEMIVASLQRLPTEILGRRMSQLNIRPHRSIKDEDAFTHCFEIRMQLAVRHDPERKRPKRCAPGQAL